MPDTARINKDKASTSTTRRDTQRMARNRDTGKLLARAQQPWRVALMAPALELNGITIACLNLARTLTASGSQVALVSPGGALREAALDSGSEWIELPAGRLGFFARRHLREHLAAFDPEVLHAIAPDASRTAVWAADLLGRPLIVSVHGVKPGDTPAVGDSRYDAYIASDHAVREHLLNECRLERDRTTLLPEFAMPGRAPVEREVMNPRKQPVVGFVSPLFADCGYRTFVDAAMRVMGRGVDCMFAILGDGPQASQVRDLVEERGMQQRMVIVQSMFDYGRIWEPFDVIVVDSRQPASAVMVLQAMAHGLPVVSTEGGAVFDVIKDGVDGLIVPRDNPDALAERLLMLIQNPTERLRMARACFQKVEEGYDVEFLAGALGSIYAACTQHEPLPKNFDSLRGARQARKVS